MLKHPIVRQRTVGKEIDFKFSRRPCWSYVSSCDIGENDSEGTVSIC